MARMLRRSPVHSHLAAAGAHFSPVVGWEIADFYRLGSAESASDIAQAEYAAAKTTAILADDCARAKVAVIGPGAEDALRGICAGFADMAPNHAASAFLLNPTGGIDCAIQILRLNEQDFHLTAPAARSTYLLTHLGHGLTRFHSAHMLDVTAATAVFVLGGPGAVKILAPDFEGEIDTAEGRIAAGYLAGVPVRLVGTTPFGGDGFEIHVATEYSAHVFEALQRTGAPFGLRLAGSLALDMLRIDNGIPAIGREMDGKTMPLEIAAGTAVTDAASRRLKQLFVRGGAIRPKGRESVFCRGKQVGTVTSAAYSPTADGSFLLAFIDSAADLQNLEIEAHAGTAPAQVCDRIRVEA